MENLITYKRNGRDVNCYFTVNPDSKDFDDIRVIDSMGERVNLTPGDIEKLKDLIAEDIVFAAMEYKTLIAAGTLAQA